MLIAAQQGASKQVVSGLQQLGATAQYRDQALGYVRASVPSGNAAAVANLAGVQAVDVDEIIPLDDPTPAGAVLPTPQTPPQRLHPTKQPVHAGW